MSLMCHAQASKDALTTTYILCQNYRKLFGALIHGKPFTIGFSHGCQMRRRLEVYSKYPGDVLSKSHSLIFVCDILKRVFTIKSMKLNSLLRYNAHVGQCDRKNIGNLGKFKCA